MASVLDPAAANVQLDYAQLEALWIGAGGSSASAPIAAAIAQAESAGNSAALNAKDSNGLPSKGLWQINGVHYAGTDGAQFYDPQTNAAAAVALWKAKGGLITSFSDWGTYTRNVYKGFLQSGVAPASGGFHIGTWQWWPGQGTVGGTISSAVGGAAAAPFAALWSQVQPVLDNWIFTATAVAIGLAIAAGGFAIAASSGDSGSSGGPKIVPVPV